MYRKFLSAILFGALTIASTSTFVSCKDYDDDIDALNARVDANDADNKALHDALDAANQELTNLKAQLASEVARLDGLVAAAQGTADQAIKDAAAAQATADQAVKDAAAAQATADQALKLSQENKEAIAQEIIRATAAEEALRVRIQTLEEVVIPELRQLIKDLDDKKLDKKTFNEEVAKIYTRLEAVETGLGKALERIETLEKGLADEILARKALAEDLEQQKKIIANHETRLKELEEKVVPELRQLIQKLREDYEADVKRIDGLIDALDKRVKTNEDDIKDLKEAVQKINEELTKINNRLNELNVLILKSLRSLVFIPDFYYFGIEATEVEGVYLSYVTNLPTVTPDANDPTWSDGKTVACYPYKKTGSRFIVNDFVANYHLNPSSADLSKATINILQGDREYRTKAFGGDKANTNIAVASFDPEKDIKNGDLHLKLNILDPKKIENIGHIEDGMFVEDAPAMVTVFAAEVALNDEFKNTITSDYAALRAVTYINGYRLAHTATGDVTNAPKGSYTGVVNETECGDCDRKASMHLFTDADETVYGLDQQIKDCGVHGENKEMNQPLVHALNGPKNTTTAQDSVRYNKTLNLSKLVEVHLVGDENTPEKIVDLPEGYEIQFELTGIILPGNKTSESAHAFIEKTGEGYILYPSMPVIPENASGQATGRAPKTKDEVKIDRTTIGRTPLVRVKLVDEKGNIVDYGFIRIVIVDEVSEAVVPPYDYATVEYETGKSFDYTYNDCEKPEAKGWTWKQTWASFEADIYNKFHLSQVDFENRYDSVTVASLDNFNRGNLKYGTVSNSSTLAQYIVTGRDKDGKAVLREAKPEEYLGEMSVQDEIGIGGGTTTQVITWTVQGDQLKQYVLDGKTDLTRAVKYQLLAQDGSGELKDIFVIMNVAKATITKTPLVDPTVEADFDTNKIPNFWYNENTTVAMDKLDEAHLNVPSPEDWIESWQESQPCPFEFLLASDFTGNKIFKSDNILSHITVTDPNNGLYDKSKANVTYGFVVTPGKQGNATAKGYSGKTYTISTDAYNQTPNWGLYATNSGKRELIAYLEYDGSGIEDINHIKIVLNKVGTGRDDEQNHKHTNSFAEDILNYKPNEAKSPADINNKKVLEINDDVLKAIIGVNVEWEGCRPYKTTLPAFQVRFLRPINLIPGSVEPVQDAGNTTQLINLYDLVQFTDWRWQWNPTAASDINKDRRDRVVPDGNKMIVDYWFYYGIKHIIVGDNGDPNTKANLNGVLKTNLGQGKDAPCTKILADVTKNVTFEYLPAANTNAEPGDRDFFGEIKYTNNQSTVDEFDVEIPVVVCYEWGHLKTTVKVQVRKTLENTTVKARR